MANGVGSDLPSVDQSNEEVVSKPILCSDVWGCIFAFVPSAKTYAVASSMHYKAQLKVFTWKRSFRQTPELLQDQRKIEKIIVQSKLSLFSIPHLPNVKAVKMYGVTTGHEVTAHLATFCSRYPDGISFAFMDSVHVNLHIDYPSLKRIACRKLTILAPQRSLIAVVCSTLLVQRVASLPSVQYLTCESPVPTSTAGLFPNLVSLKCRTFDACTLAQMPHLAVLKAVGCTGLEDMMGSLPRSLRKLRIKDPISLSTFTSLIHRCRPGLTLLKVNLDLDSLDTEACTIDLPHVVTLSLRNAREVKLKCPSVKDIHMRKVKHVLLEEGADTVRNILLAQCQSFSTPPIRAEGGQWSHTVFLRSFPRLRCVHMEHCPHVCIESCFGLRIVSLRHSKSISFDEHCSITKLVLLHVKEVACSQAIYATKQSLQTVVLHPIPTFPRGASQLSPKLNPIDLMSGLLSLYTESCVSCMYCNITMVEERMLPECMAQDINMDVSVTSTG